jgi:hypothetical protein
VKVFTKGRDVLRALAQRRHADGDDVETIKQIFTKQAAGDGLGFEIFVRGGNDAGGGTLDFLTAHRAVSAVFEHAQEVALAFA